MSCSPNPPKNDTSVGVVQDSCFRQIEFAGVLKGTPHADAAHKFIDFMLSKQFQEDMPLQMYVYPVRTDAALPDVFTKFAVKPPNPIEVDAGHDRPEPGTMDRRLDVCRPRMTP